MKKLIYTFAALTTAALMLFSGCASGADTKEAQTAAKKMVESLYTVKTTDVETFNNINNTKPENDGADSIKKAEDSAAALTEKLNSKFKNLVTSDEYTSLIKNITYTQIVKPASNLNCQLTPKEVTLDGESKNGDSYKYNYTIKVIIDTAGAGEKEIATESGIVEVEKTGGKWLANYVTRIKTSELLTE